MELDKLTIEQLKAMAYEQIKIFEQARQNIVFIEQEIAKRKETEDK